jgi:hypothetical protein
MPERANSLASAFIAGTLAAALLGVNTTASAAAECLESPDYRVTEPGHWRYHLDRTLNRRCWHFEPAEAKPAEAAAAAPMTAAPMTAAPTPDTPAAFLSRFAAGVSQTLSPPQPPPQPQQSSIPDTSAASQQTISTKPARPPKTVRQERPQSVQPPTTNGAAAAERQDQPQQFAADKNEKRNPPLNVADREALFQNFMKWQTERSLFGGP